MIESMEVTEKTGEERFIGMEHSLLEYWSWAHSDVASNAERGKLAEYLVKCALQANSSCRIEWDAVDVITSEGIKVEVKSSAYLQTWRQAKLSNIQFDIAPKNADSTASIRSEVKCRFADVYVFCLFASKEAKTANPLDLRQWEFYVLSTRILNDRVPFQKKISLNSLRNLGAQKVDFDSLYSVVRTAAGCSEDLN